LMAESDISFRLYHNGYWYHQTFIHHPHRDQIYNIDAFSAKHPIAQRRKYVSG
jgi:hypothetical protein